MTDDFIIGERDQGEREQASRSQRGDQERLIRAAERSLVHRGDRRDVGRGLLADVERRPRLRIPYTRFLPAYEDM